MFGRHLLLKNTNVPKEIHMNLDKRTVLGIGYVGIGKFSRKANLSSYKMWYHMLERCYSKSYIETNSTYKDVVVCDEWHNFQNFAKWFERFYPKNGVL